MLRSDTTEMGAEYADRLYGRYAAEEIKGYAKRGDEITRELADRMAADEAVDNVRVMSVLSATSVRGVPQKSYGVDPATGNLVAAHHPIGVIAAQSIGEPGTQLSLDSKHRSGAAVADDTAQGLSRVEELFEVRTPKGQAYLTEIGGVAQVSEEGDHYVIQVIADDKKAVTFDLAGRKAQVKTGTEVVIGDVIAAKEDGSLPIVASVGGKIEANTKRITIVPAGQSSARYEIPGFKQIFVNDGDMLIPGQRLTNGSINLHDLMRLQGIEPTQRYIMNEILKIFVGQGQNISDKHLEIIVRQMFSRVQIEDAGDSEFVTGDTVSKLAVVEADEHLVSENKQPSKYNQLLLGITKASLSTDSFLSAASFQDTTRVLIGAATSGRVDYLYGLKENVILGRKIPVGTGYVEEDEIDPALASE
jgi:DNA-directed RNA polymerase subunit beta'